MRRYTAVFDGVAVSAAQDLFELTAPATAVVLVHEIELNNLSEVGDAAEEMLQIRVKRGVGATSGSGGTAPTPAKIETGDPAAAATVEVNNTTKATAGTITTIRATGWNVRADKSHIPTPETRIVLAPSEKLIVELVGAPIDAITMSGTLVWEEIG